MTVSPPSISCFFPICSGFVPICSRFVPDYKCRWKNRLLKATPVFGLKKGPKQVVFALHLRGTKRATLFSAFVLDWLRKSQDILPENASDFRGKIGGKVRGATKAQRREGSTKEGLIDHGGTEGAEKIMRLEAILVARLPGPCFKAKRSLEIRLIANIAKEENQIS
jgi:hypothetical protein